MDDGIVNCVPFLVTRRSELGGVSVFSWGSAPRRFAAWLAAVALLALAVVPMLLHGAVPVAIARGPGGGYQDPDNGNGTGGGGSGLAEVWSAVRAPLRWLRQSSRSFQSLMRLLAERSAGAEPPPVARPRRPRQEVVEEVEDPPRRSSHGGEAGAGRDRGGPRVKAWHKRQPSSCRRAGLPVRRGAWYVVQRGDTLWHIAEVHFGYGEAYPRVRRANSGRVPDADLIFPCQRLYIPPWRCCGHRSVTIGERPEGEPPSHAGYNETGTDGENGQR
jgi:hypothetical protein